MSRVVEARSLCKEYILGNVAINVLKDVNLEVLESEFVVIRGASGSGKTTLLNLISGIEKPTKGKIIVYEYDLTKYNEDFLATFRCTNLGYVFQSYNLISTLTAKENIEFTVEIAGFSSEKATKKAKKLLKLVGLQDRGNHFPGQLSFGEQQRVAFARALANDPPLMLIDEPTGNLDRKTRQKIIRIIREMKNDAKTIIVATHDEEIAKYADKILLLNEGKITVE